MLDLILESKLDLIFESKSWIKYLYQKLYFTKWIKVGFNIGAKVGFKFRVKKVGLNICTKNYILRNESKLDLTLGPKLD